MNITNKRLAFYVAIITTVLSVVLPALGLDITPEQQQQLVMAALLICGAFGIGDISYDLLNVVKGTPPPTPDEPTSPPAPTGPVG